MAGKNLITVRDAAALTGMAERTIRKWIRSGKLRACKVGGTAVRMRRQDVENLIQGVGIEEPGYLAEVHPRTRVKEPHLDRPRRVKGLGQFESFGAFARSLQTGPDGRRGSEPGSVK